MKIKTFKYIILYIFLLILVFFLFKNFTFFSDYISNFSIYNKIDNLKKKQFISLNNWLNISWLILWKYDKSNLLLLNWNISGSFDILHKSKIYSYKDFYNLWNLYFIKSYKTLLNNWTWYIELNQKAISYYDTALSIIPKYKLKKNILINLWLSKQILNFMYVYSCDNLFVNMILNTDKLLSNIDKINNILKKQIWALKKWENYDFLSKCINSFEKDANKNISIIYENRTFFQDVKKWLLITLKNYQWDELNCYKNSELINQKYKHSIESSTKYFNKFYKTQKDLLTIFEKASIIQMTKLCKWISNLAKKQNKQNKQMQNNFNNLNDLTQKTKPNEKHKQHNQEQNKLEKKQWNKNNNWKNDIKKLKRYIQDKIESLNKQNEKIIEQIQKETTEKNYNPKSYLDKLFKKFFSDDSDFINGKKHHTLGK